MNKHTPEPWGWETFDNAPDEQDAIIMPAIEFARARDCVNGCKGIADPEAVGELMAAVDVFCDWAVSLGVECSAHYDGCDCECGLTAVRAAISKARGES